MATLTKEELKLVIINHGLSPPPANARKEEFLAMYNEHIAPTNEQAGEFSDDEVTLSPRKKVSQSSTKSRSSNKSPKKGVAETKETRTEENSLIAGDVDVDAIDDNELRRLLQENNVDVGPIVDSTRTFYKKKLALILRGENGTLNGTNGTNGNHGDFSDTEPETEPEEEDDQPSGVVSPQEVAVTRSRSSASSKKTVSKMEESISEMKSGLRKRLNISDELDSSALRHTPTPRRSIHTYKVTETTRQVVELGTDGVKKSDTTRVVEKSESKADAAATPTKAGFFSPRKLLLLVLLVLILIFAYVYITKNSSGGMMSVDKIMASMEKSLKGVKTEQPVSSPPSPPPPAPARPADSRELPEQMDNMA